MKQLIPLLSLLLVGHYSKAQNLDSLYTIWQDSAQTNSKRVRAYENFIWNGYLFSRPDTAEVMAEALHAYANKYSYLKGSGIGYNLQGIANQILGNYPRALECYQKSVAIDEDLGDKNGIANGLNNMGNIYLNQGNYPRALECYQRALSMEEDLGSKKGIAMSLGNIGLLYSDLGNNPRALEYIVKSLAIQRELGHKRGISTSLNNIGNIYFDQGNYSRALEYYQQCLAIDEDLEDKNGIASDLNNIGLVYSEQGNYPSALEYFQKSLTIEEELGNKEGISNGLGNIGVVYSDQANYPLALKYCEGSLAIEEELGDKNGIASSLKNIGDIYAKQGKNRLALDYCQRGLVLAEEIGALDIQKNTCECLYNANKALGIGNEALVYLEKMNGITDSLQAEETTKKLEQMEFAKVMLQDSIANAEEARLVEEAHQEEVRKKNRTRNMLAGGGVFLFLIAGGFYSRWRYVQKAKVIVEKEKDRSNNLLLNILPADIAEELKIHGKAEARDFDKVSMLFTDFKGFTQQSAKLTAAELVDEINQCFEAFDGIMEKYCVEKIKTIGDAYMAAGGLPVQTDDSVKNTVLAALDMQQFITDRKTKHDELAKPAFEMRVGIHTGPVVAGIVGVKKFQYDIWGDTVNTAARMESNGTVGRINISQATYQLLKDDPEFAFEHRGKIEAKGKGEVEMYFVSKA